MGEGRFHRAANPAGQGVILSVLTDISAAACLHFPSKRLISTAKIEIDPAFVRVGAHTPAPGLRSSGHPPAIRGPGRRLRIPAPRPSRVPLYPSIRALRRSTRK